MFKVGIWSTKIVVFICFEESTLKMIKNTFYFYVKSYFWSRDISTFLMILRLYIKNGLIRKLKLFSKFATLHTRQQIVIIYILPKISRTEDSQKMKFAHNMRNIFLEKLFTTCGWEISSIPSYEKFELRLSLDDLYL